MPRWMVSKTDRTRFPFVVSASTPIAAIKAAGFKDILISYNCSRKGRGGPAHTVRVWVDGVEHRPDTPDYIIKVIE